MPDTSAVATDRAPAGTGRLTSTADRKGWRSGLRGWRPWLIAVVTAFGVAFGAWLRVRLLIHQPLTGDEAVAGLMAEQIRHGHFYTFYWGNQYGGVELYVITVLFALLGASAVVLNGTAVVVTAVAAVALWWTARHLHLRPPSLAVLVAVAFWVWPEAALWTSTREYGFREVTMLAGITAILLSLRYVTHRSLASAGALGLMVGIGWWSSPEIVYFLIAVAVALVLGCRRAGCRPTALQVFAALGAFVLSALPWLWTNAHTNFASLRATASPTYGSSTYGARLDITFTKTLPMMLGLRAPVTGAWVGGRLGEVLYPLVSLVILVACVWGISRWQRPTRAGHIGCCVATLAFPFVYALFPATDAWQDGHYGVFFVPLVLLALAGCAAHDTGGRHRAHQAHLTRGSTHSDLAKTGVVALAVVVLSVASLMTFNDQFLGAHRSSAWSAGRNPNATAEATVGALEAQQVTFAYADYWTAYDLDFLSDQRLIVTDPSADRWVPQYRRVRDSANPAWLFYDPAQLAGASAAFGSPTQGPFAYSEALFTAALHRLGVPYRITHAGVLDVITTGRKVDQREVGMGTPAFGS